jgi:transposase
MYPSNDGHTCEWHKRALALQAELDDVQARLDALTRRVFGTKAETMPSKDRALKEGKPSGRNGPEAQAKRRERAKTRKGLVERPITHPVSEGDCACEHCGGMADRPLGKGRLTVVYELVPASVERENHTQQTLACRCGRLVVTAPPPVKVADKLQHGPKLIAQIVVSRTLDSLPFYRQQWQFGRLGIPLNRSTMCELYHRAAELMAPIYRCVLDEIAADRMVMGDETHLNMHGSGDGKSLPGYMWTFRTFERIAYVFDPSRSGDVPLAVLGNSEGVLLTDAYAGYSPLYKLKHRLRAACLAHVRREFFEARSTAESAVDEILALILAVYRVEDKAREQGILRTPAHRALRQAEGRPAMQRLNTRLLAEQALWTPRSRMGKAIAYALKQWGALCLFLDDENIPPDNNLSENALRIISLGRKNWQLVGHKEAGQNTAILQTLMSCCVLAGVNPLEYLADVLIRVQTHPDKDIAELLPERWKAARDAEQAAREAVRAAEDERSRAAA